MIVGQDRTALRKAWAEAWHKHCEKLPITALEEQIVAVVAAHPEYHAALSQDLDSDFTDAAERTNPFLHMSLHLGLREQVATDRPTGIAAAYATLVKRFGDEHAAEHRMIDCLAETLWEAQRAGRAPDETRYIERLKSLAGRIDGR